MSEQAVVTQSALHDELIGAVDDRTRAILERRRDGSAVRRRGWLVRRLLLAADVFGLLLAFLLAEAVVPGRSPAGLAEPWKNILVFVLTLPLWVVVAKLHGLYDHDEERTDHTTADDVPEVFHLVSVGSWLVFIGSWLFGVGAPSVPKLIIFWATAILLVSLGRGAARMFARRSITYLQNTIVVGAGDVGQSIARKLLQHPEYGIHLVGFVDAAPKERPDGLGHVPVLGPPDQLPTMVRLFEVERVVVAFTGDPHEETLELVRSLKDLDIQIDIVPRLFEVVAPGVGLHTVEGLPLVGLPPLRLSRSSRLMKRTLDLAVSFAGLLFLLPLFAVIAWRIKAESEGPVFFRQLRVGTDGTPFRIYKFRTMVADAEQRKDEIRHLNMHAAGGGDPRMFKVPHDPRTTSVGRFLRRYSLDELPQLINVLKGEMSLVGPRPLILEEAQFIAEWARKRLSIKPGITGLWQVLGRSEIPFDEMTKLDYLYVTNWSLWGDICLLFRTFPAIFRPRRAY